MISVLIVIFLAAFASRLVALRWANSVPYVFAAILAGSFVFFFQQIGAVQNGVLRESYPWAQEFGVHFAFLLDGLSLVFALLITGIGTGVFIYAASYMRGYEKRTGFFATLMIFTGSMLGLVLSDNVFLLFIFWELTSLTSFLLIGFKNSKEEVRDSAKTALYITVGGGLFLLVSIILLSAAGQSMGLSLAQSLSFSELSQIDLRGHDFYPYIILTMLIAVATKSAQIPFHFWLPLAMAGPTPVSSFLHSATMVKAGIFLLARSFPVLGGTPTWTFVFVTFGALTMVGGAVLSASQRDMKKILAYSTISVLGTLVMLLGLGTSMAIKAAVVYVVAHALYKASLFQVVGNIDMATQSRDLKTLSNLRKILPFTAIAALLASLSMSGAPPLFGFFGKELSYMAKLEGGIFGPVLMILAVFANILLVGLALSICYRPFWRSSKSEGTVSEPSFRRVPLPMSLVPLLFACVGFLVGVFPRLFDKYLGTPMATAIAGDSLVMKLKLWHGFNIEAMIVLAMSIATIGFGLLVAKKIKSVIRFFDRVFQPITSYSTLSLYNRLFSQTMRLAEKATRVIQNGHLVNYLRVTFLAVLILVLIPGYPLFLTDSALYFSWAEIVLGLVICIPIAIALFAWRRLSQVALIAISGFGIVVAFALNSAMDLAMTQLMVETLSIVFIFFLIKSVKNDKIAKGFSLINMALALGMAALLFSLFSLSVPELPQSVSQYFIENSYLLAYGKNIVNVILVDYRSLDTFGEVIVIGIAALGVGALLSQGLGGRNHD